jgi:hypothetical protein
MLWGKLFFYYTFKQVVLSEYVLGTLFISALFARHSTVSEDAGIEPRTAGTLTLVIRRSNHSARCHPQLGYFSFTTRLDLIHARLDLIHAWLNLIQNSATSHPRLGYRSFPH